MSVSSVNKGNQEKSTFLKKASHGSYGAQDTVPAGNAVVGQGGDTQGQFKFDFTIDSKNPQETAEQDTAACLQGVDQTVDAAKTSPQTQSAASDQSLLDEASSSDKVPSVNYFKMDTTDRPFQFNFDISDKSGS